MDMYKFIMNCRVSQDNQSCSAGSPEPGSEEITLDFDHRISCRVVCRVVCRISCRTLAQVRCLIPIYTGALELVRALLLLQLISIRLWVSSLDI